MTAIIGIDLGTTFSCAYYVDKHNQPEMIPNTEGTALTASAVWIDEDDNMVVGQLALDNAIAHPRDVITLAKNYMGQDVKLRARDKEFTPQEVSAIILKKIKQDAERELKCEVTDAVITCPAFFGAAETRATEEAGKIAGFNVRRIFPEPAAAALAFGFDHPDTEQTLLVYDLGGGTFDITLFKVTPPKPGSRVPQINMISTGGNRQLGGTGWDSRIVDFVADAFIQERGKVIVLGALKDKCGSEEAIKRILDGLTQLPSSIQAIADEMALGGLDKAQVETSLKGVTIDPRMDDVARQDLFLRSERAKCALSRMAKTSVVCQHQGQTYAVPLTREKFAELTKDLLALTESETDKLLAAVNKRRAENGEPPIQIDQVLCVGGSTRLTMVLDMLRAKFPGRVNNQIQPDLCVAQGAAIMGKLISEGVKPGGISITPHGYGVLGQDADKTSKIYPVLLKDMQLPCASPRPDERERPDYDYGLFHTGSANMTRVLIQVFEFDAITYQDIELPGRCREVGKMIIEDLPPNRPPGQPIFITFSMDESLQLAGEALDMASGKTVKAPFTFQQDATAEGLQKTAARAETMGRTLGATEILS